MTDDEAFVRAVVDRPGDDTPRLVYADWLDEHGDPRGAYLRAEVAWAKARTAGKKLRAAGQALDPVWVARVSRPPLGVCCDHLRLSATGEQNQPAELDAAGAELGVVLPSQLRAIVLNYSLGHLRGGPFVMPGVNGGRSFVVNDFVCLYDPEPNEGFVSRELVDYTAWFREEYELGPKFVYLASTFSDDQAFVVSCRKADHGSVHLADGDRMLEEPGSGIDRVAPSVGAFLAMLEPRTWPLTGLKQNERVTEP